MKKTENNMKKTIKKHKKHEKNMEKT